VTASAFASFLCAALQEKQSTASSAAGTINTICRMFEKLSEGLNY
jgi:hypothetical protein